MKKLLILLLAILAIVVVAYFCLYEKSIPTIEKDLSFRSQDKLNSNDMGWAKVHVSGRDITLTGTAPSKEMSNKAQRLAQVEGVNFIDNKLTVVAESTTNTAYAAKNKDYRLTISKDNGGKLILEGVMSAEMHKQVMTEATAKMGVDQLIDRIIDKDIDSPKELPVVAAIMLTRVAALEDGRARLAGKKLLVSGSSPTQEAIEQIKQRTDKGLPQGFESQFNLSPPAAVGKNNLSTTVALSSTSMQKKTNISTKKCQKKFNKILLSSKIVFNSSSAVIKKSSYKVLKQLADVANQCTSYNIHVHGHTDTTGRNQLNQRLSKKRAQAVANYLTKKGVNPKHVHAIGHGSSKPIAGNNTAAGRARNRRIELTVED